MTRRNGNAVGWPGERAAHVTPEQPQLKRLTHTPESEGVQWLTW